MEAIMKQPTLRAKTYCYRGTSTTSAVGPENSLITYARFAIKLVATEATQMHRISIDLFLGFVPLFPLQGNFTGGLITSSNGVQFRHVAAAQAEHSMMKMIQTANQSFHRIARKGTQSGEFSR